MRHKIGTAFLCICLLVSLMGAGVGAEDADNDGLATTFAVNVVHTNDIHGRVKADDYNQVLGLERVKAFADQKRQEADGVLLLDAGDYFHGQSIATMDQGESVAELLKACGYDAMAAGNHDWNYGKDQLKKLGQLADLPVLAGNVMTSDGVSFFEDEFFIKEVQKDGQTLKIGVFGVIDPLIYDATAPTNVEGLEFTDMTAYAKKAAQVLKEQGCQLVIGIAHCVAPAELARSVDGVSLWIAGHEHYAINEEVITPNGETSLVVETGYNLWTIGDVAIECAIDEDGNVVSMNMQENLLSYQEGVELQGDAGIQQLLDEITERQKPILERKVGHAPEYLDGVWEHVRVGETTLGRAVTNGYLLATGADLAFENAGGIRASIEKGTVTYQNVLDVSPYGNYVVTKELTGTEILSMLETSLELMNKNIAANEAGEYDGWPGNSGNTLQMAGIEVVYDMSKEAGSRILESKIQGQPIAPDQVYVVAMNNYLATDTDDYPELGSKGNLHEYDACEDILGTYLSQEDSVVLNDIHKAALIPYEDAEEPEIPETPQEPQVPESPEGSGSQTSTSAGNQSKPGKSPETGDTGSAEVILAVWMIAGVIILARRKYVSYQ